MPLIEASGYLRLYQRSSVFRSADYSLVLLYESGSSVGRSFSYDSARDAFIGTAKYDPAKDNVLGRVGCAAAVSRNGSLVAIDAPDRGMVIRDRELNELQTLTTVRGIPLFDPVADVLYVADAHTISAYDTNNWMLQYSFPIGEPLDALDHYGNGVMTMSADGRYLFLATTSGIRMFDLEAGMDSHTHGAGAMLVATVTAHWPDTRPAGVVTFTDVAAGRVLGRSPVLGGTATLAAGDLSVGQHTVMATYEGDARFLSASSPATELSILRSTTQIVLASSGAAGDPLVLTANATTLEGEAVTGDVTLMDGDVVVAKGQLGGGAIHFVVPDAVGQHAFRAVFEGNSSYAPSSSNTLNPAANPLAMIDVLVLYTSAARHAIGGSDAALRSIRQAIADANRAFVNSSVNLVLRLVHAEGVDYAESGDFETDVKRLQAPADGILDSVQGLREQWGADVVSLFVSSADNTLGIAFQMLDVNATDNADKAHSVVCLSYAAAPYYTLAHEVGHNLGAAHDIEQRDGAGAFPYSYGYRIVAPDGTIYRDMMGYPPGVILPYFSSPNIAYYGMVIGSAQADNARTINQTAGIVARYRAPMTHTVLASSAASSVRGALVSFTATVRLASTDAGTVAGEVVFRDGDRELGRARLVDGSATWTTSDLAIGSHSILASYVGHVAFGASASSAIEHRVAASVTPIGRVELATERRITGWAFDGNAGAGPATIRATSMAGLGR